MRDLRSTMTLSWEQKSKDARDALARQFPADWLIPNFEASTKPRDVRGMFQTCGLLTAKELEITDARDATTILEKIRIREWSAKEVTIAFCKRATVAHQLVNCLIDANFDAAIQRATELDEHLHKTGAVVGPLHGLPISLKDLTSVKGMRWSIGYATWGDRKSTEDAWIVQSFRKAGAVVYVKSAMPQTGMALETVSNLWGRTLNPFNTSLSAGGSSGGESSLNASHGAAIGIATDIGGSIRAPAAFCGLYGIKPSSRRCSYMGSVIPVPGQIAIPSAIGPIGRSLRDLELICQTWSDDCPWKLDPSVVPMPWVRQPTPPKAKIGVMWWDEVVMPHPPVKRVLCATVERLKALGHEVVEFRPLRHAYAWEITRQLYFPTAAKQHKELAAATQEPLISAAAELIEELKELTVPELMSLQAQQAAFQAEYAKHWESYDIDALLTPSFASASYPHDYLPWWGYFSIWNILNYPAIVLPAGTVDKTIDIPDKSYQPVNEVDEHNYDIYDPELFDGTPVSLQVVGKYLEEEKTMAVSRAIDLAINQSEYT